MSDVISSRISGNSDGASLPSEPSVVSFEESFAEIVIIAIRLAEKERGSIFR